MVVLVQGDHEAGDPQRSRIVAAVRNRGSGVTQRCGAIILVQPEAKTKVIAPGQRRMSGG
jgi:hypothetical protein